LLVCCFSFRFDSLRSNHTKFFFPSLCLKANKDITINGQQQQRMEKFMTRYNDGKMLNKAMIFNPLLNERFPNEADSVAANLISNNTPRNDEPPNGFTSRN